MVRLAFEGRLLRDQDERRDRHISAEIELDIPARRLDLRVPEEELARRRGAWKAPPPRYTRGYGAIFSQNVTQANEGCDFAVLADRSRVPEPDIY